MNNLTILRCVVRSERRKERNGLVQRSDVVYQLNVRSQSSIHMSNDPTIEPNHISVHKNGCKCKAQYKQNVEYDGLSVFCYFIQGHSQDFYSGFLV